LSARNLRARKNRSRFVVAARQQTVAKTREPHDREADGEQRSDDEASQASNDRKSIFFLAAVSWSLRREQTAQEKLPQQLAANYDSLLVN